MNNCKSVVLCAALIISITACTQANQNIQPKSEKSTITTTSSNENKTTQAKTTVALKGEEKFMFLKTDKGYSANLKANEADTVVINSKFVSNEETSNKLLNDFDTITLIPTDEKFEKEGSIRLDFTKFNRQRGLVIWIDKNNNVTAQSILDEKDREKVYKIEIQKLKYEDILKLKVE